MLNLTVEIKEHEKIVKYLQISNVFTDLGRDWLSRLLRWQVIGATDVPEEVLRPRWIIVGTGFQMPLPSVTALQTPVVFDGTNFLKQLAPPTFSPVNIGRYQISYPGTELASVNITELGLVVDNNSLAATTSQVTVIAYRSFTTPIVKTSGQTLTVNWSLIN